jgi:hypothetical protein
MTAPPNRVPIGQAAVLWVLVFLIGLTGGAVLRQGAGSNPTYADTNGTGEPAVQSMMAPPSGLRAGSFTRASVHKPVASNGIDHADHDHAAADDHVDHWMRPGPVSRPIRG